MWIVKIVVVPEENVVESVLNRIVVALEENGFVVVGLASIVRIVVVVELVLLKIARIVVVVELASPEPQLIGRIVVEQVVGLLSIVRLAVVEWGLTNPEEVSCVRIVVVEQVSLVQIVVVEQVSCVQIVVVELVSCVRIVVEQVSLV